jgi:hypothetical protein
MIDLSECEQLLRTENNIHDDVNLIFLKFEKLTKEASEKNVQFEVYNPNNKSQLDLSICYSTPVNLYMPVTLNEKTQSLYNNLKESGYDLFNENDSFYQEICTPYKSENQKMIQIFYYQIEKMIILVIIIMKPLANQIVNIQIILLKLIF